MPETEPRITAQAKQHLKIHRCIENPAKHLKWSKKELLAKIIIAWNYFPKTLQYVRQGCKYRQTFGFCQGSEYDREGSEFV